MAHPSGSTDDIEMQDLSVAPGSLGTANGKRKAPSAPPSSGGATDVFNPDKTSPGRDSSSDKENKGSVTVSAAKKLKLDNGSAAAAAPGGAGAAGDKKGKEKELVELTKSGKWTVRQKVKELCDCSNAVKKDVFNFTDQLEALSEPLTAFSDAQLRVLARLSHESDKSLPELAKHLHAKLLPQAALDEDSQTSNPSPSFDRLPMETLKQGIEKVAKRVNYGIEDGEVDWLPCPVPSGLKIFRWEALDLASTVPSEVLDSFSDRQFKRLLIKRSCLAILEALSPTEREELVAKVAGKKGKAGSGAGPRKSAVAPPALEGAGTSESQPVVLDDDEEGSGTASANTSAKKKGKAKVAVDGALHLIRDSAQTLMCKSLGAAKSKEEKRKEDEEKARLKEERAKAKEERLKGKEEKQKEREERQREKEEKQREKEEKLEEKQKEKEEKQKEKEEKQKEKEEKQKEKDEKRKEKEEKAAEKEQKKTEREEKKKQKEEVEASKKRATAASAGFMMGFFAKNGRSASPEVSKLAHKRGSIGSKDEVFATPGKPASASPMTTAADGSSPNISRSAIKPFSLAASGSGSKPRNEMSDFDKAFKPFNVKTTVTMAPVNRFAASDKAEIEVKVGSDLSLTREASLSDFLRNVPEYRRPVGPRRIVPRLTVREVLRQMAEAEMAGDVEGSRRWRGALNDRQRLPVKTLCFHEDVRPGYVGTWTKATRSVRPLKPFGKDTCLLNYEYDSEGDWEEDDAEGEDLNDEEEEEEGEAMSEADSEEDGWLVADDDVEMADATSDAEPDDIVFMGATGELADQQQKRKRALQEQKKKAVAAKKRRIVGPLIPIIKGPLWEERLGQVESQTMEPFRIQFLNDSRIGLDPFSFVPTPVHILVGEKATSASSANKPETAEGVAVTPSTKSASDPTASSSGGSTLTAATSMSKSTGVKRKDSVPKRKPTSVFPPSLMAKFIVTVDGAKRTKPILIEDLRLACNSETSAGEDKVTKLAIEKALADFADKGKKGGGWKVKEWVKQKYAGASSSAPASTLA